MTYLEVRDGMLPLLPIHTLTVAREGVPYGPQR